MCGIAGIIDLDRVPVDLSVLHRMTRILAYRGPDDEGYYVSGGVGLGHRRLSIIDLSPRGRQPLCNPEGTAWITFNGEIYNYRELRKTCEARGYRFQTDTDTEVILAAYALHGDDCVSHLRGMFSFAIWDSTRQRLFAARDRIGKKPFWYYHDTQRFLFASELKAILQAPGIPRDIDSRALAAYLEFGVIPAPYSIFKGIRKLPQGSTLALDLKQRALSIKRYWTPVYAPRELPLSELERQLRIRLARATALRMIADVPLGVFLSGGIDSAAITALMARQSETPVKTFTIGFTEDGFNETAFARLTAERFGTDHHELFVTPDACKVLPRLVWLYNEPFADSSALPSYYVAQLARRHVTVALNGDGGDEAFGGYDRYALARASSLVKAVPRPLRTMAHRVLAALPEPSGQKHPLRMAKRLLAVADLPPDEQYLSAMRVISPVDLQQLSPTLAPNTVDAERAWRELFAVPKDAPFAQRCMLFDMRRYLPDDLLVKMDIASMAHALEARSPFLDQEVMEFSLTVPVAHKLAGFTKKYLLRRAFREILPKPVLWKRKTGFAAPINIWFNRELASVTEELLTSPRHRSRGLTEPAAITRLLEQHRSRSANHAPKLWSLLWLELWFRTYVDAETVAEPRGNIDTLR